MSKLIISIITLFTICGLLADASVAQSDTNQQKNSSRFDITLNSGWVSKLKSLGTLQSTVREDVRGKIAAIQLEFARTENQPPKIVDAPFSISGDACQIAVNDDLIAAAQVQPVRVKVPQNSQFSQVFLNYVAAAAPTPPPSFSGNSSASRSLSNPQSNVPLHFVKLSENKLMMGQMDLTEKLTFTTRFGEVDISLGQIAGIRFHIDGEDSAIIVLKNGDSVTGVPALDSFTLNTDWGRAEFDPVYVESITTNRGAAFRQTNDPGFGPRWELSSAR